MKLSAAVLKKLTAMQQNRRHDFTSYFCLLQKFKDAPTGIRSNISHLMLFKPKNEIEKETIASELFSFNKKKSNRCSIIYSKTKTGFVWCLLCEVSWCVQGTYTDSVWVITLPS